MHILVQRTGLSLSGMSPSVDLPVHQRRSVALRPVALHDLLELDVLPGRLARDVDAAHEDLVQVAAAHDRRERADGVLEAGPRPLHQVVALHLQKLAEAVEPDVGEVVELAEKDADAVVLPSCRTIVCSIENKLHAFIQQESRTKDSDGNKIILMSSCQHPWIGKPDR